MNILKHEPDSYIVIFGLGAVGLSALMAAKYLGVKDIIGVDIQDLKFPIAKELGAGPEAARDVGQAMAKNPVALIIPCHRVLAAGGKIGGFSAPGGATSKTRMLELEGVVLAAPAPAQQSLAF